MAYSCSRPIIQRCARGAGLRMHSTNAEKKILILGTGLMSRPVVEYLIRRPENRITVGGNERPQVTALADTYGPRVTPAVLDISDESRLEKLVSASDLVVSILPAHIHVGAARCAVAHGKDMVTASYVSPGMKALDDSAKEKGVLLLNEAGLDPGFDGMTALQMIDHAHKDGAKILSFRSLCGGIPAPSCADANLMKYKFSWTPLGAISAHFNPAKFMEDGQLVQIEPMDLVASFKPLEVAGIPVEMFPNRDSTVFAEQYGLRDAPTFVRGTLRHRGFCERLVSAVRLGLLSKEPCPQLAEVASREEVTAGEWFAAFLGTSATSATKEAARARLGLAPGDKGLGFLEWLGLFGEQKLQASLPLDVPAHVVTSLFTAKKEMFYGPGEKDMALMYHELVVELPDGSKEKRVGTFKHFGEVGGHSSMAKTVGSTAAVCSQMLLDAPQGHYGAGVHIPLSPKLYTPALELLKEEGMVLSESREKI